MDLNLLSSTELDTLNRLLKESERIVLICHSHPDGDSLGSALAWSNCLKEIYAISCNGYPVRSAS